MIKTTPKKKKYKKAKVFSEEALQKVVKRKEAKGKGEMERYTYLMQSSKKFLKKEYIILILLYHFYKREN